MSENFLRFSKVIVFILTVGTAVMYLLNGLVAAVGFDGLSIISALHANKGVYLINTIAALILIVISLGVYSHATKLIKILALIGVVVVLLGYILNPVGLALTVVAMVALVLALITVTTVENIR